MNIKLWNNLYKGSERYSKAVEAFKSDYDDPIDGFFALSKKIAYFSEEIDSWEEIANEI